MVRQPETSQSAMAHTKSQATFKREASKAKELALQHTLAMYQEALASNEVLSVCDANAALQHWKAQQIERYNEDIVSYQEECTTLAADGVPKKFWPKKPTHPTQGRKANQSKPLTINYTPPLIHTTCKHHTATPADHTVDLEDDPEDSEYKNSGD